MEAASSSCPGCGAVLAGGALPYRGYYNCSAECWSEYTHVLHAEYQDPALFAQVHQLSVDAFAVQHAGGAQPDKSVCVHLFGLHLVLERGVAQAEVPARVQQLVAAVAHWPHFELPTIRAATTAHMIARSTNPREHAAQARIWAAQVWATWSAQHAAIAKLAALGFATSGSSA